MNIISNSECVKSKYFTSQTDMDESLSDFQEEKKSCKGPKPGQKSTKPKIKKVNKRIKGQKDIRTALKGTKNELISYSKEFDTVCKKSGLEVDSEQLQLAIALSKSLQTESNNPESSQALSSQQRVAKIRKTLQEYGFKVPEAKITARRKPKKYRKKYKLLTVTEEEKHQNITGKYTRILFENLDQSRVKQSYCNDQESDPHIFYIASNIPYECIKDNNIFYVEDLVEKSTTNGSLLRDWSEIPGRPESPKLIDTYTMNFKDIDCSQDELDIILSGPIESVKDIFACKEIEYKRKHKDCDVPKIVIEAEEKIACEVIKSIMNDRYDIANEGVVTEKSPFQKALNKASPTKIELDSRSPVKNLCQDKSLLNEEIEIIAQIKQPSDNSFKEIIDIETSRKLTVPQRYRSCSPDIFDDELSSIMETSKPIVILSQEHKIKVFSQDNYMDLTQCANIPSQNSGIQLSQNVTKRRSNDFMEITDCIVGSSQPIREVLREIDLKLSPEDKGAIVGDRTIKVDDNFKKVSTNAIDSFSQNITDEPQITVLSNHPNTDSNQTEQNIDLTQSDDEDAGLTYKEENNQAPGKKAEESMDLTQSSNSTDISLPLVDVGNSQSQASLDDTIIVDKEEYIAKSVFRNEAQVFDLTQAPEAPLQYHPSPVNVGNTESCSNSFCEDFVYDHSESTGNSKEIARNFDFNENNSSYNKSKESNDDIDLTQDSNSSEEMLMSQRPISVLQNIPNNSGLGKQDDVSIDYDEIIMDDDICERANSSEAENYSSQTEHFDSSYKSEDNNDIEILDNDNVDIYSSQNPGVFHIADNEQDYSLYKSRRHFEGDIFDFVQEKETDKSTDLKCDSSKSEVDNDIEIIDDNNDVDINSSQNSGVFHISDKELDYSLYKSRRDFTKENIDLVQESLNDKSTDLKYDTSKSEVNNHIEMLDNDVDINSSPNFAFPISVEELGSIQKSRQDFTRDNFDFDKGVEKNSSKSEVNNDIKIVDENNYVNMNSSQSNAVFQIACKELDYSLNKSRRDFPIDNLEIRGLSVLDNVTKLDSNRKSLSEGCQSYSTKNKNDTVEDSFLPEVYVKKSETKIKETTLLEIDKAGGISPIKVQEVLKSNNGIIHIKTPKNSEYIIKTVDVTPMADYASMSTPQRNRELDRFGLKPLKRKRAIQILTHIYNQTHPTIQQLEDEDQPSPSKKARRNTYTQDSPPKRLSPSLENSPSKMITGCSKTPVTSPKKFSYKKPTHKTILQALPRKPDELESDGHMFSATSSKTTDDVQRKAPAKSPSIFFSKKPRHEPRLQASPKKTDELNRDIDIFSALSPMKPVELERERHILRDILSAPSSNKTDEIKEVTDVCGYEVTSEDAVVKSVDCNPDDWVFQKREKAKIYSCRVPLHIAFHNYVLSRRSLREAILKYEPVNIDVIHKDLVSYGHRYDPKDLLKFLDKKCITVKTADNNARNSKR